MGRARCRPRPWRWRPEPGRPRDRSAAGSRARRCSAPARARRRTTAIPPAGEQTTPASPASAAIAASRSTSPPASTPVPAHGARVRPSDRARSARSRPTSASIVRRRPRPPPPSSPARPACGPSPSPRRAPAPRVTAPATVLGMSCHLRSRKTRSPRSVSTRIRSGAFPRHEDRADLHPPASRAAGRAGAARRRRDGRSSARIDLSHRLRSRSRTIRSGSRGSASAAGADRHQRGAHPQVLPDVVRRCAHRRTPITGIPPVRSTTRATASTPTGSSAGSAHAAVAVAQPGLPASAKRRPGSVFTTRDRVGAGVPRDHRHPGNVRQHRRQLGDEREPGARPAERHDPPDAVGVGAELDAAGAGVGTGQVELEPGDARGRRRALRPPRRTPRR